MRTTTSLAWLALTSLMMACQAHATVIHVDNSCAESGSGASADCGSPQGPLRTIAAGVAAVRVPGDVVRVRATDKPYVEASITTGHSGRSDAPITLTSYDDRRPVWTGLASERLAIDHAHWIVERFEFDGSGVTADLIKVRAPGFTLRDCDLHDAIGDALSVGQHGDNLTVERCRFHDLGAHGDKHAIVTGKERGDPLGYELTGLKIVDNVFRDLGGDGIQLFERSDSCREATVTGLIARNSFTMGTRDGHENGMDIKTRGRADDPLVIDGNTLTGWDGSTTPSGSKPLVLQHCSDHVHVTNNVISRGKGTGECDPCFALVVSASTASRGTPVRGVRIVGNTFYGQKRGVQLGEGTSSSAIAGIEVYNNTGYGIAREMFRIAGPITGGKFHNNLVAGRAINCTTGGELHEVTASHNGWFGKPELCKDECGSICSPSDTTGDDPGFTDPTAADFTLAPGSPAIDRGTDVGLPFSGPAPDLGAHEKR